MAKRKTRPTRPMAVPPKQALARPNWFAEHPVLTACGIFLLLAMIFFFNVIFGGKTYLAPDAQSAAAMSAPLDKIFWETWKLPLWSPYIFCGMPSFASLMYAPFVYMPGTVLLPIARLVSLPSMFSPALHYVLAAMGVFLFLRRKGVSFLPGLLGGIAFMFTPFLITMQVFGHGSQMMTAAYIPWALWAVDRLLEKFSWRNLGLAGLILGFQLQRGHVQIAYYSLLMVGLYVIFHFIHALIQKEYKRLLPMLGGVTGAIVLAGALAAVLYLPLQEYTPYSIRGTPSVLQPQPGPKDTGVGFEYATQWSFSPGEMLTFIIPSFYGFGGQTYWGTMPFTDYPNYMGILVLALALSALIIHLPAAGPNRLIVAFLGFLILLALLLSFGYHFSAFYKLFYNYFPYFNKFRVPVMILILVQCAVAILAGLGLEGIVSRLSRSGTKEEKAVRSRMAQRLWIALAAVFIVVLLLTIFRSSFFEFMRSVYPDQYDQRIQQQLDALRFEKFFWDMWIVAILVAGGLVMFALALTQKISATTAALSICLFTVIDLWVVDKKLGQTYPEKQLSSFLEPDEIARFLRADSSVFRIYPAGELFRELRWSGQGFQSVGGYHAAKPRLYQDFIEAMGLQGTTAGAVLPAPHIVDMLNAKYLITFDNLPDTAYIVRRQYQTSGGGVLSIYENPTVLPRAYLVGEYQVEADPVKALARLRSGSDPSGIKFDPHHQVLLNEAPEFQPQPDTAAFARISKYDVHHIQIETKSIAPQILVLSDNYYPVGWQAFVDKQPVKTYRANYCFRALCVPAGSHQVEFRFHSGAFTKGLWISLMALVAAIVLLFVKREKSTPPQ
ncbi:MAG: YfhO family protein [candidate division KSB1 bacterium]|nr:YfhO family protein [candidate division KSB1 bacterium]MDZ7300840.1 YfhO family protein [candidate division KSB1 bacterium]MDZ7309889.1 YfhO family protein [candidate division KSB1 bacterium]